MATQKKATKKTTAADKSTDKSDTATKEEVVIHMTRQNPVFEIANPETKSKFKFTQASPFVIVESREDVNFLLRHDGMEIATPEQVAEYYDK